VVAPPGAVAHGIAITGLYFAADSGEKVNETPTKFRLIPYYAWSNRAPSSMQVWVPYKFS